MFVPIAPSTPVLQRRFRSNQTSLSAVAPELAAALGRSDDATLPLLALASDPAQADNFEWNGRLFYAGSAAQLAVQQVHAFTTANQSFVPGIATYSPADEIA